MTKSCKEYEAQCLVIKAPSWMTVLRKSNQKLFSRTFLDKYLTFPYDFIERKQDIMGEICNPNYHTFLLSRALLANVQPVQT